MLVPVFYLACLAFSGGIRLPARVVYVPCFATLVALLILETFFLVMVFRPAPETLPLLIVVLVLSSSLLTLTNLMNLIQDS